MSGTKPNGEDGEELTLRDRLDDCYCLLGALIVEGMDSVELGNGVRESVVSHEELVLAARLLILRNVGYLPAKVEKFQSFSLDDAQVKIDYFKKNSDQETIAPKKPVHNTSSSSEEEEDRNREPRKKPAVKKPAAKLSKTAVAAATATATSTPAPGDPEEQLVFQKGSEIVKTQFLMKDERKLSLPELRGWLQHEKLRMDCGTRIARKSLGRHWRAKNLQHLKDDVYARVSKSWVDEIGVGVSAIRPVGASIVVDRVPSFLIHELGYHFDTGRTLSSVDIPAEDLKYIPRQTDEYLRSMQCVDYSERQEGVMHLGLFGPNSFIGLSQWVNAAIKGKANATFGAGEADDITYNHKIQTIVECAEGEEFTVEYNSSFDKRALEQITGWREKARQFQKNASGNDGMNNDVKLHSLPVNLKHLEGTFYICGCYKKSPLFRKKGETTPAPVWIAFQDERWTFYTNCSFDNDAIILVQSKKRKGKVYPHEIDEWTYIEPVSAKTKSAKRRKKESSSKEDLVKPKFSIVR